MSKFWKAVIIGSLLGCAILVFGGEFKGNLAEPEFLAHYVGYVAGVAGAWTIIYFLVAQPKQGGAAAATTQPPQRSQWFFAAVVALPMIIIGKVVTDFPNGEGLFHPTHAANVAEAYKVCLKKVAGGTGAQTATTIAFCTCWANEVALAAEKDQPEAPEIVAPRVNAACRQQ
jgi:ABC-type Fe3+-siderophore transport system permease subunit